MLEAKDLAEICNGLGLILNTLSEKDEAYRNGDTVNDEFRLQELCSELHKQHVAGIRQPSN